MCGRGCLFFCFVLSYCSYVRLSVSYFNYPCCIWYFAYKQQLNKYIRPFCYEPGFRLLLLSISKRDVINISTCTLIIYTPQTRFMSLTKSRILHIFQIYFVTSLNAGFLFVSSRYISNYITDITFRQQLLKQINL